MSPSSRAFAHDAFNMPYEHPVLTLYEIGMGPCPPTSEGFSGLQPEIGKHKEKIGFVSPPPQKNGESSRRKSRIGFWGHFPMFGLFFLFGGRPKPISFLFFRISGRRQNKENLDGGPFLDFRT